MRGPRGLARDVSAHHEVAAQERGQRLRIKPVGLDLRVGDEPRPERMRQNHFLDLLDVFEQIVCQSPVPARFEHPFDKLRTAAPCSGLRGL